MPGSDRISRDGQSLTLEVVDRLTGSIRDGAILPGRKLPSESELIERFGVSRTVIREALSRLQAAGLVETQRGRGTFVLTVPNETTFGLSDTDLSTVADLVELVDFRLGVEVEAAGLAATRHTAWHLQQLADAAEAHRHESLPNKAIEADFHFHLSIARAASNRFFVDLLSSLGPAMIVLPRHRFDPPEAGAGMGSRLRLVTIEHDAIYDSIAARDPIRAQASMRMHLSNSRERLRQTATPSAPDSDTDPTHDTRGSSR